MSAPENADFEDGTLTWSEGTGPETAAFEDGALVWQVTAEDDVPPEAPQGVQIETFDFAPAQ